MTEPDNVNTAVVEAATEYFFLHFGSKRDVSKRYILSEDTTENSILPVARSEEPPRVDDNSEQAVDAESHDEVAMDTASKVVSEQETQQRIPLELKRTTVHRSMPKSIADEVSSMILEIPNENLQEILQQLHVPPLPPPPPPISSSVSAAGRPSSQEFLVSQEVGRLGECLVYQYLKSRFAQSSSTGYRVQWLNDVEDSRAPYDLVVDPTTGSNGSLGGRIFVEVKSSRYDDNNVFQLTLWEWEFLIQQPAVPYHVYRVFSVLDKRKTRIVVLTNVRRLVETGRIQLCLSI